MWPIKYTSSTIRVDIKTGEQLTENKAKSNYTKIRTIKKIEYNYNRTKAHITYTIEYQINPQLKLY